MVLNVILKLFYALQFPGESGKKKKVWELYLLYPIEEASRIAFVPDKAIAHTYGYAKNQERLYISNGAVLLPIIFGT